MRLDRRAVEEVRVGPQVEACRIDEDEVAEVALGQAPSLDVRPRVPEHLGDAVDVPVAEVRAQRGLQAACPRATPARTRWPPSRRRPRNRRSTARPGARPVRRPTSRRCARSRRARRAVGRPAPRDGRVRRSTGRSVRTNRRAARHRVARDRWPVRPSADRRSQCSTRSLANDAAHATPHSRNANDRSANRCVTPPSTRLRATWNIIDACRPRWFHTKLDGDCMCRLSKAKPPWNVTGRRSSRQRCHTGS